MDTDPGMQLQRNRFSVIEVLRFKNQLTLYKSIFNKSVFFLSCHHVPSLCCLHPTPTPVCCFETKSKTYYIDQAGLARTEMGLLSAS